MLPERLRVEGMHVSCILPEFRQRLLAFPDFLEHRGMAIPADPRGCPLTEVFLLRWLNPVLGASRSEEPLHLRLIRDHHWPVALDQLIQGEGCVERGGDSPHSLAYPCQN